MKKITFFILLFLLTNWAFSQNNFTNGGGDNLWSNAANWSGNVPNAANAKVVIKAASIIVDGNYQVGQFKLPNQANGGVGTVTVTATGGGTLTITGKGVTQPIAIGMSDQHLIFNCPVILDSSEGATETVTFNSGLGSITFGAGHSLTVNDQFVFAVSSGNAATTNNLYFNGTTSGAGNLKFGNKSHVTFGSGYDGSSYTGTILIGGNNSNNNNVTITSNVADNGTFIKSGAAVQVVANGGTLTVNGANTFKGNLLNGVNAIAWNINANQSAMGTITKGSGAINLRAGDAVTSLAFADISGVTWNTTSGKLNITNIGDSEVSFGTDASGLTDAQLARITLRSLTTTPTKNSCGKIYIENLGVTTFTNGGGNNLWSNACNWSAGIPNTTAKVTLEADLTVDASKEISQIKMVTGASASTTVTAINSAVLTLTGAGGVGSPIYNAATGIDINLNLPVILPTANKSVQAGAGTASITFGDNSDLTLSANTKFLAQSNRRINMNGVLRGSGQFQVGAASKINFGSTSNNAAHTGGFKMLGNNSVVTVNTAANGTFLASEQTIIPDASSTGHTITVNTANVLKGNISILGNPVALNINANQSAVGTITMTSGTLNLAVDAGVTSLIFADNSSASWGSGTLTITGAADTEVGFGTDANGLTTDQLAQITLRGLAAQINSSGKLSAVQIASSTFNNSGGNNLWSNAANWSAGIPTVSTASVTLEADLIVDASVEIAQIELGSGASANATVTATNSSILTINGTGVTTPIYNNQADLDMNLNLPVVLSSSDVEEVSATGTGTSSITFGANSDLTLSADTKFSAQNNRSLNMNGVLRGSGQFQVGAASKVNFGSTSNNAAHSGGFKMLGNNSVVTVNTAADGTFLKSGTTIAPDANSTGHTITLNTANVFKGNVSVLSKAITLNVNANQSAVGTITMTTGTLNLALASGVTSLIFTDNSSSSWGTGTLAITGAADNEVGFGTDNSSLTTDQLAQITVGGSAALINSSGKIYAVVAESTFTSAGSDNLWSNTANWSAGIPNVTTAKVTLNSSLTIDTNVEIAQVKLGSGASANTTVTATGSAVLTLNGTNVNAPVYNAQGDKDMNLNLPVILSSSAVKSVLADGTGTSSITFGASSDLTLSANTKFAAQNSRSINMNGVLQGAGQFQVGAFSKINFGSTSNNAAHTGGFKMLGNNSVVTVNTAADGTFLKAGSTIAPDVSSTGHTITVNTANVLKGNISILGNPINLNINANQSAVGTITMTSGTLNLALDPDVTSLIFADNSSSSWGTGKLVITGAGDNEVAFGSDANGLTENQLISITLAGSVVEINASGQIKAKEIAESIFTNAGGDHLWSNEANWSSGIPNVTTAKVTLNDSLIIDSNIEIAQIKLAGGHGSATVSGSTAAKTLTLNGTSVSEAIQNNGADIDLQFNMKVIINSQYTETIASNGNGTCSVTFGPSSELTLNNVVKFFAQNNKSINMNGVLQGVGEFRVGAASKVNFGSTSDNSSFTGGFKMLGSNSTLNVNTAADGTFLKSGVSVAPDDASTGHKITVNTPNVIKGNISILGNPVKLNINANQSAVGTITMTSGKLVLTLGSDVSSLVFANNSASDWGSGTLEIIDFRDNIISFGSDDQGLSANQLSQINIGGEIVKINNLGNIYNGAPPTISNVTSSLSNGSYTAGDTIPINIIFNEVVNVTGTPVLELETGISDVGVAYTSGTGTDILTFNYIVGADHNSDDLDYVASESLTGIDLIKDIAGNSAILTLPEPGATGSLGANKAFVIDNASPTLVITATQGANGFTSNDSILSLIFTISEATADFTAEDITATGGVISDFISVNSTVYTATLTPSFEGTLTIDVAAATFKDVVGNFNVAAEQFNWIYDISAVTMTITAAEGLDGFMSEDSVLSLTFTANKPTSDFSADDITVTGGVISNFVSVSSTVYTAIFTPSDEGAITIDVGAGAFEDDAGNFNVAALQFNWTFDIKYAPELSDTEFTIPENSPSGTVIGTLEASDGDGDTLSYTIVSGNDAEAFSLDSESGELTVLTSSALDFETSPLYSLGILVSDGALTDSATVIINLTDLDEFTLSLVDDGKMVYPNPSNGIINIRLNQFKKAELFDLSGKKVLTSLDRRMDISSVDAGIYLITLERQDGTTAAIKVIKK